MAKKKKFYDTNAVLRLQNKIFEEDFALSSTTLHELEHIKTSKNKDEETKYNARKAIHLLDKYSDKYEVVVFTTEINELLDKYGVFNSPDNQIVACAKYYSQINDIIFVTNDICCKVIAKDIFKLNVESIGDEINETYKGFIEKSLSEEEMAYFYGRLQNNTYNLLTNEYLILKNDKGEVVDKFRWDGYEYQNVKFPTIKSNYFGSIKPYNGDIYQQLALNSFSCNQVTMIKGAAGTGKSYLALGYLMWLLEKRKIEKIIMFANPIPTANSAKLGFLPGSQLDKLIDSSVGNMLASKFGDKYAIEQLVTQNKLSILPMCDIRGFDTNGMSAGVYITEAQNLDISLMKLALQRIGEDSICIIDGDFSAQVDLSQYAGNNNGMRRMSEVFRGQDFYGEVELQNIYRSKISEIAELM